MREVFSRQITHFPPGLPPPPVAGDVAAAWLIQDSCMSAERLRDRASISPRAEANADRRDEAAPSATALFPTNYNEDQMNDGQSEQNDEYYRVFILMNRRNVTDDELLNGKVYMTI